MFRRLVTLTDVMFYKNLNTSCCFIFAAEFSAKRTQNFTISFTENIIKTRGLFLSQDMVASHTKRKSRLCWQGAKQQNLNLLAPELFFKF